jgi:hypothetical protein
MVDEMEKLEETRRIRAMAGRVYLSPATLSVSLISGYRLLWWGEAAHHDMISCEF